MDKKILFFSVAIITIVVILYLFVPRKETYLNESLVSMKLDSIESVMLNDTDNIDSLLMDIDTISATKLERARYTLIEGFTYYKKSDFANSIRSLEKSESYFYLADNKYYIHLSKLIKAFTLEFLILHDEAAIEYRECEAYFEQTKDYKYQFYALIGLLRLSEGLHIEKKQLIEKINSLPGLTNQPYYKGLLFSSLAIIEANDSLVIDYREKAFFNFLEISSWENAFDAKINMLAFLLRKKKNVNVEEIYSSIIEFSNDHILNTIQKLRLANCYAGILIKNGYPESATDTVKGTLKEAKLNKIIVEEINCYKILYMLHKNRGDYKSASQSLFMYYATLDRNNKTMQNARLLAVGANYRFSNMEKEKILLKSKMQRFFWISMFILTLLILVVILYRLRIQKSKMREQFLLKKNQQIEEQINDLIFNLEQQEEENYLLISQVKEAKQQFVNKREINAFLTAIDNKEVATWMEFESWFLKLRPFWVQKLQDKAPILTSTDVQYCMCFYFNLNNATVSQLCSVGIDAVKSAKKRLREKLDLSDTRELYFFLKEIE